MHLPRQLEARQRGGRLSGLELVGIVVVGGLGLVETTIVEVTPWDPMGPLSGPQR